MKRVLGILTVFLLNPIFAQNNIWKIYSSTNDDLADNKTTAVLIDKNNNKWIGSREGLTIFNGNNRQTFTAKNSQLPSDKILCFLEEKDNIWIGTAAGVLKIDGNNWEIFNNKNSKLSSNKIRKIIKNKKSLWLATEKGIVKMQNKNIKLFDKRNKEIKDDNFLTIAADQNNNIWAGSNSGLLKINNGKIQTYNSKNSFLPDNHVWNIVVDKNNNIWVGTKKGLLCITDVGWRVYNKENSKLPHNAISALAADDYDRLWIATEEGVCSFDGSEWSFYKTAIKKMKHYNIYIDKDDNKWIGTEKALLVLNQDGIEENTNKKTKKNVDFKTTNSINKNKTKISYFLPSISRVCIKIFSYQGKEITTIIEETKPKGQHHFYYNTQHLSNGTYLCQFNTDKNKKMQKIVVMK